MANGEADRGRVVVGWLWARIRKFWRWLWSNARVEPPAPATAWLSSDTGVVTVELGAGCAPAAFDVEVTGLDDVSFQATYTDASLTAANTALVVTVGQGSAAPQVRAAAGDSWSSTAENLNATQTGQSTFRASSDGKQLELVSLTPGPEGKLALSAATKTLDPVSTVDPGTASIKVNGASSALLAGTTNRTSPATGVTLIAQRSGRARVQLVSGAQATMPGRVLVIAVLWIVVLAVVGLQYPHFNVRWFGSTKAGANYLIKYMIPPTYGPVPGSLPFFGAAGGLLISLEGIFNYNQKWDSSYNYWHYLRPVVGALTAVVAGMIILFLVASADSSNGPNLSTLASTSHSSRVLVDVAGILVGYREATFRSLIKRVVDVIVGPAGDGTGSGTSSVTTTSTTSGGGTASP